MIAVRAHAKINLGLKVQGRREDGYHEIRSTLQAIDLHDDLRLEEAEGLTLRVEGDFQLPTDSSNLVMRAAEALHAAYGGRGARILLTKRIPPGSGLGGGSSDAAATLMGLDRLWGIGAGAEKLFGVARTLGSDVPFFLYGGACLALGRGDDLFPLPDLPEWQVLVVWPGVSLSTREVYAQLPASLTRDRNLSSMRGFNPVPAARAPGEQGAIPGFSPAEGGSQAEAPQVDNDLEETSFARVPQLSSIKRRLLAAGAVAAAMSGSGSAVYGLFPRDEELEPIRMAMEREATRVFVCRTLSREAYGTRLFESCLDFS